MTTSNAEHGPEPLHGRPLLDELFREKDVKPFESADDLTCEGIFESDKELADFLAWVAAERRTSLA